MLRRILIVLATLMLAQSVASAQALCNDKKCNAAYHLPQSSGTNNCYLVQINYLIVSGDECTWNGSVCVGDPCSLIWSVNIELDPKNGCDEDDCSLRLRITHEECETLGGSVIFTPTQENPTYEQSGFEDLACGCSYLITVNLANPLPLTDPCVGGFSAWRSVSCTECEGIY